MIDIVHICLSGVNIIGFQIIFRYLNPPAYWVTCTLESRELMALCLKRLKNLSKVKLIDANFVWTEPHSKRIKVLAHFTMYMLLISDTFMMNKLILRTKHDCIDNAFKRVETYMRTDCCCPTIYKCKMIFVGSNIDFILGQIDHPRGSHGWHNFATDLCC
jgi:hypothetical protein